MIAPVATPVDNGVLVVEVSNVRNAKGTVHVELCDQQRFLTSSCPFTEAPAKVGVTSVVLHDVAPGQYAIQAYQDENHNKKIDRALFGIPREGVGFSRNARIGLGPPKWQDAMFYFDGRAGRTALRLRYFLGPSGPPASR